LKIDNTNVAAIIFDLGGVILNLDYHLTIKAFEKLGLANSSELFSQKSQSGFFDDFETGKISAQEFRKEIRKVLNKDVSDTEIDTAWNAMLLDFPTKRFDLISQISSTKRIFLLSNTNEIHMAWFKNYVNELFGVNVFFTLFEVAYLSNEMGMRKPNVEIFEHVISENNLDSKTTLFIDDSEQHLIGAKNANLQTHWLQPNEEITTLLSHFLA
jgi:putative hydrolase of the HAD superfamily